MPNAEHGDGKAGPTALMSDAEMDRTLAEAEAELARGEESDAEDAEVSALMPTPAAAAARTEDDEACGALFKGLTFFLPREVRQLPTITWKELHPRKPVVSCGRAQELNQPGHVDKKKFPKFSPVRAKNGTRNLPAV
jgi:hypothetical protein